MRGQPEHGRPTMRQGRQPPCGFGSNMPKESFCFFLAHREGNLSDFV